MATAQPVDTHGWHAAHPEEAGALRVELAGIVAALTTHFDAASQSLADAVAAIDQIVTALGQVAGVFDNGEAASAVDDLMSAAEDLRTVKAHADSRARDIAEIRRSSDTLRASCGEILRCIQVLDIYGMNVKITASGRAEFMDFADRMRGKLSVAGGEVQSLDTTLALLEDSLSEMRRNDDLLVNECAKVVPHVPDRLVRDAEALKQHQAGLVRLAQSTNAVAQAIRGELGLALGAIQIGDRVRQRLEHVIFGCQLVEDSGHSDDADSLLRKYLMPLLGALTTAAIEEFDKDAQSLVSSLHRLQTTAKQLIALQEPGHDEKGDGFLSLLEEGIADAEGMIAQFGQADRQGSATLALILRTVDDVAAKMADINEMRLEVQNMAINIGLSCRNVGQIGRPIMVVAKEIRTYSDRLDLIITSIARAEKALLETSSHMQHESDKGSASVGQLSHCLELIHACNDRTANSLEHIDSTSENVGHLLDRAIAEIDQPFVRVARIVEMTNGMDIAGIDNASPPEDATPALQRAFDAMARTYTMHDERQIHNLWTPPFLNGIAATQVEASPVDDDEDDGLF